MSQRTSNVPLHVHSLPYIVFNSGELDLYFCFKHPMLVEVVSLRMAIRTELCIAEEVIKL
jgi:hypothetical protein